MATVPFGCVSEPLEILATMLSYCPAFQLWVAETEPGIPGTGNPSGRAAACRDYIHYPLYAKPDGGFVYPAAVIEVPESLEYPVIGQSVSGGVYGTGYGVLHMTFFRKVPEAHRNDDAAAWLDFAGIATDGVKTGIGAIILDLQQLGESVEKFEEYDLSLVAAPGWFTEEKRAAAGHVMLCTLGVTWGTK